MRYGFVGVIITQKQMEQERQPMKIFWEKTKEGTARVLRVFGTQPKVCLPKEICGLPLTEIGAYCFARKRRLPEHYEKTVLKAEMDTGISTDTEQGKEAETDIGIDIDIDMGAELAGDFITEVCLPDGMEKIGNLAFYNCTALKKIELGSRIETVGSDAFMNCRNFHQVTLRCGVEEQSGLRLILNQVSSDMEAIFRKGDRIEASVFYPEYYEQLDEIAPAHIFHRNIEGEGFRARQCFKSGVPDLTQYDGIFPKACVEESAEKLQKMACGRLRYPAGLTEEAKQSYETYVKTRKNTIIPALIRERNLDMVSFFCENGYADGDSMEAGVAVASEMEWAEGVATLMHLKQKYFAKRKERYSFEDF